MENNVVGPNPFDDNINLADNLADILMDANSWEYAAKPPSIKMNWREAHELLERINTPLGRECPRIITIRDAVSLLPSYARPPKKLLGITVRAPGLIGLRNPTDEITVIHEGAHEVVSARAGHGEQWRRAYVQLMLEHGSPLVREFAHRLRKLRREGCLWLTTES
jgi:hypothetical protein